VRAAVCGAYGPPEVVHIEEVPSPPLGGARRARRRHPDEFLRRGDRERAVGGDPLGDAQGRCQHLAGCDHDVDEPELVGAGRVDTVTGERELEGDAERHAAPDVHHAGPGEESALDLGQPEGRVGGRDDDVAGQHELEPAGDGAAVHRSDHGNPDVAVEQPQVVGHAGLAFGRNRSAVVGFGEGAQVHARAEGAVAGTGQDDHSGLRIGLGTRDAGSDVADHRPAQRVAGLGPVEAQDEDGAPTLGDDLGGVGHDR